MKRLSELVRAADCPVSLARSGRCELGLFVVVVFFTCCCCTGPVWAAEGTESGTGGTSAQLVEKSPTVEGPVGERFGIFDAAVLGVVEGLTEYLPVSSTGHLIVASHWMGLSRFVEDERGDTELLKAPALDAFEIVIQVGAILAVLGIYHRHVRRIVEGLLGRDTEGLQLLGKLLIAFFPAAIMGILYRDDIKALLFNPLTVAVALAGGGVAMIVLERFWGARSDGVKRCDEVFSLSYRGALVVGLFQCLALCPGMSRSMVTIVGGVAGGLGLVAAAEFSFLLALPTLGGATVYEGLSELDALTNSVGWGPLLLGIGLSWALAALTVKGLVRWLTGHGLTPFGLYRVFAAVVIWAVFLWGG